MKNLPDQIQQQDLACPADLATRLERQHIRGSARNCRRQRRGEIGQSMVEMAFVLPLFLAMVLAIMEMGRAWSNKQSLTLAAREGARVLVLPHGAGLTFSTESEKQDTAVNVVASYLANTGLVVGADTEIIPIRLNPGADQIVGTADDTIEPNYAGGKRGDRIGIQIKHPFDTPLPVLLSMFGNSQTPDGKGETKIRMGVTCYLEHE